MAMATFPHEPPPPGVPPSSARVIMLDTLSLAVTTADSLPVFGTLGPDRPFRASVQPGGALAGLTLTVALSASQVPYRVLLEPGRLWIVALLLGSTIVLVVIAAGASRRETLLARARSDFIAGVSHDLRMPLAQVLLAGETLALDRVESAAQRRTLAESIVREARRLTGLVDNVLLFSRSGAVALGPARQAVAVDGLLAAVAESVGLSVTDAGQALEVIPAPGLMVRGDHALLRQALVNLVDNALKYGARGQVIRLEAAPGGAGVVELRVEDAGPGIPPAERDRVLEPYRRLAVDHDSERTGSGLGLAVVRQIALACGGSVHLEDTHGGGTRAVLRLRPAAGTPG
jgi:signal transduction histidine kinase